MSVKKPIGDPKALTRRLNPNPKFSDVESVLDTGNSVSNIRRHQDTTVSVKQQPGELFRRIRPGTLALFVQQQQAKDDAPDQGGEEESVYAQHGSPARSHASTNGPGSPAGSPGPRTSAQHNQGTAPGGPIPGGAFQEHARPPPAPRPAPKTTPQQREEQFYPGGVAPPAAGDVDAPAPQRRYLVLDVRDREEYDQCHIAGAVHYPPAMLNRQNPWTPDLFFFKNRANHVVVVYDLDEELVVGKKIGNLFFERGVDNVVTISGGLKEFVQNYAQFVVGEPPVKIAPRAPGPALMTRARDGALVRDADLASTRATSVATSHKPKALASSLARGQQSGGWR